VDLSLWLHRFEGFLFAGGNDIQYQLIDFNSITTGTAFNLSTDTWTVDDPDGYNISITILNADADYELAIFANGVLSIAVKKNAHPSSSVTTNLSRAFDAGTQVQLFIRPQEGTSMGYRCTAYTVTEVDGGANVFTVTQTAAVTYFLSW
jgi:hypothetical protein